MMLRIVKVINFFVFVIFVGGCGGESDYKERKYAADKNDVKEVKSCHNSSEALGRSCSLKNEKVREVQEIIVKRKTAHITMQASGLLHVDITSCGVLDGNLAEIITYLNQCGIREGMVSMPDWPPGEHAPLSGQKAAILGSLKRSVVIQDDHASE